MSKNDKILIITILIISLLSVFVFSLLPEGNKAIIYQYGKNIKEVDLNKNQIFTIEGFLGEVKIEVNDNGIRVIEEVSPKHLCSRQGYINSVNESIICLPNKVVIEIVNDEEMDEIVK